ncbi:hypothetical protein ES703_70711 [subsurface metagenome]
MNPRGQAKQVGQEEDIINAAFPFILFRRDSLGRGPVELAPAEDKPYGKCGEKSGCGVNFRLHRVEPVAVGDHESEGSQGTCTVGDDSVGCRFDVAAPLVYQLNDNQVKEHDGQGAGYGGNDVNPGTDITEQGQEGKQSPHEQKERAAGRMGHAHDVGGGNKLAAVPEGGRGRHGIQIQEEGE